MCYNLNAAHAVYRRLMLYKSVFQDVQSGESILIPDHFNMWFIKFFTLLSVSFCFRGTSCSPALPATQHLNLRDQYLGGWPLALTGSNSESCPQGASVQCTSSNSNPECCPSGQTCFSGATQVTNYCCPTSSSLNPSLSSPIPQTMKAPGADCNTAVLNFPRCANTTWNKFFKHGSGYFCCELGTLGVLPAVGTLGGICEPSNLVIPTSLLATLVSQVGLATQIPTASALVSNATRAESAPTETSSSLLPSNTPGSGDDSTDSSSNLIAGWIKPVKIGVGAAIGAAFITVVAFGSVWNRRRRNNRLVRGYGAYWSDIGEFDEYGNRVQGYSTRYGSYRRAERPTENNFTVNVVQGDLQNP